jgi:hypothetical protein
MRRDVPGDRDGMSILLGNEVPNPPARRTGGLTRETRESAALILMALAVVLTVSFIGLAIA